jgi:cell wall-associated NlpC family hydrolase
MNENFKTGDLLFFKGDKKSLIDDLIMDVSHSPYSHIGMIIVNPPWDKNLKGPYLLQSSSNYTYSDEDRKEEKGVTLSSLPDNLNGVNIRRYDGVMDAEKLTNVHDEVHHLPYDTSWWDWIVAGLSHLGFQSFHNDRHDNNFWCSALVAFVYVKMGILPEKTNWSNLAPGDLATMGIQGLQPIEEINKVIDTNNDFTVEYLNFMY